MSKKVLRIAEIGEKVLLKKAKKVDNFEDDSFCEFIDSMMEALVKKNGVGISAPQVFKSLQIAIIYSFPNSRYPYAPKFVPEVMINPIITKKSKEEEKDWEGCLSVPGIIALIPRSKKISLEYQNKKGENKKADFEEFVARIIQHEVDHLEGKCILDRVGSTKDIVSEKIFKEIIAQRKDVN